MKLEKYKFKILAFLTCLSISLLLVLILKPSHVSASTVETYSSLLPTLSQERRWGTKDDDELIGAFTVKDDVFLVYNGKNGIIQSENWVKNVDGRIVNAVMTNKGICILIEGDNVSIKTFSLSGEEVCSYESGFVATVQYFGVSDGKTTVGVREKGDNDYIFTLLKFDDNLSVVYERQIYSLYNLSLVKLYDLSNKTVMFFNAEYGSVKRVCSSVVYNESKATETSFYGDLENGEIFDVIPFFDSWLLSGKIGEDFFLYCTDKTYLALSSKANVFGDGKRYFYSCSDGLYEYNNGWEKKADFTNNAVVSCYFYNDFPLFCVIKNKKTYIFHPDSGMVSFVLDYAPEKIIFLRNIKVSFFASAKIKNSALSPIGGTDIYMGTLC